jgi:hypothetical protein
MRFGASSAETISVQRRDGLGNVWTSVHVTPPFVDRYNPLRGVTRPSCPTPASTRSGFCGDTQSAWMFGDGSEPGTFVTPGKGCGHKSWRQLSPPSSLRQTPAAVPPYKRLPSALTTMRMTRPVND